MRGIGSKYAALVACVVAMFVSFVACGSQLYKLSLNGDTQVKSVGGETAEVTDPSLPGYGLHAAGGWVSLPIHFQFSRQLDANQQKGITNAMHIWELAAGRNLFVADGADSRVGDDFPDLYSSLNDETNGFYFDDNWAKMVEVIDGKRQPKSSAVLATTIWNNSAQDRSKMDQADMRFNSHYYFMGDSLTSHSTDTRDIVDIETLALHELGHMLGLAHINDVVDSDSIMVPQIFIGEGLSKRRLSKGDVERIQKIYGCNGDACDHARVLAAIDKFDEGAIKANSAKKTEQDTAH